MARLGMFLIRVVVWASEQLMHARVRPGDYVRAAAAHVSLAAVGFIGASVDRLASRRATGIVRGVRSDPRHHRCEPRYRPHAG